MYFAVKEKENNSDVLNHINILNQMDKWKQKYFYRYKILKYLHVKFTSEKQMETYRIFPRVIAKYRIRINTLARENFRIFKYVIF